MGNIIWRKPLSCEMMRCDYDCEDIYMWQSYRLVKFPSSLHIDGKWGLFDVRNNLIDKTQSIRPPFSWASQKILKGLK